MPHNEQPLTPRQERYLARLAASKERLLAVIADLDEHNRIREAVVGDWTVKDMLGHIVSWNDEFRREIRLILDGIHPGYELVIDGSDDFAAWNQRWIARKREWTWKQILNDVGRDYDEEMQLILGLSPQDFRQRGVTPWKRTALTRPETLSREDTDSVDNLVTFHWRHIYQHVRMIEKWEKTRGWKKNG